MSNDYVYIQIFAAGSAVGSEMESRMGGGQTSNMEIGLTAIAKVTVNGSQTIEGRWRQSGGTGEIRERSIMIQQVAP